MKLKITDISVMLVCLLIFLSFFIPRNISWLKLSIIILALMYYMRYPLVLNFRLTSMRFLTFYLVYSIWSSLHGFWNNNPGVYQLFRMNVIYFLMLYMWILLIKTKEEFKLILKTCCLASVGISVYTILFFAQSLHFINLPFFIYLDMYSGSAIHDGYVHITNMNMSMMSFLFPMILFMKDVPELNSDTKFKRINRMAVFISIIAMMLTGRRVIWITLFGASLCYTIFSRRNNMRYTKKIVVICFSIIAIFYILSHLFGISIEGFIDRFGEAFRDYDNYGRENVRISQMKALWRGFLRYPIFGSGAGIGVPDVIRSIENPSSYELSYNLILYNAGIVGIIPYVISLFLVLRALYKYGIKDGISKALFWGLLFGLIANATNPYFSSSFDFLLWVFIPLMYLNVLEKHMATTEHC